VGGLTLKISSWFYFKIDRGILEKLGNNGIGESVEI
jgi:hypothetical protein